ncbi:MULTISPECIES: transcription antitermination factor NusB [Mesonia]|uniref:transcription antitermination factor NusB n=1 Tax=Mesonia TaxID=232115 RepID=UPI000C5BDC8A|nr:MULTISPECIES: transcription antitermination factor NusB [Mesonia]MAN26687.1 transcription antitermination factor NusB [Mesonia sp.]MBJ96663.1 transcription antitermination factor NusB [Flavobacteriaceae bacterium]
MLTRRHIRVKVMQSVYAFNQSNNDSLQVEQKFLQKSMEEMYDLFLLNLSLLVEIKNRAATFIEKSQQKYLATAEDKNPNLKFVQNELIQKIEQTEQFNTLLEDRKLNHWKRDDEYVGILWTALKESELYTEYLKTRTSTFKEDKDFVIAMFKEIVAPNEKLYEYLEDKKLTWLDDLPIVNTSLVKLLKKVKETDEQIKIPKLFKNLDDKEFAKDLFNKTVLHQEKYEEDIEGKTPNWDKDRIAEIDAVLLKMAICEFLKFSSIPVKVTINEYLEIAKEYSTPKSSIFINGILDKLSKEYQESKKLNKIGRGLM